MLKHVTSQAIQAVEFPVRQRRQMSGSRYLVSLSAFRLAHPSNRLDSPAVDIHITLATTVFGVPALAGVCTEASNESDATIMLIQDGPLTVTLGNHAQLENS
jgi:hypothetical protein